MSVIETAFQALVSNYLDSDRADALHQVERAAKKGLLRAERAQIMVVFARARVAHPAFGQRSGFRGKSL